MASREPEDPLNSAPAALTRFWFPIPGHLGIGVTAPSLAEATEMAAAVAAGRGWTLDARLVEQNVDVRTLRLLEHDPDPRRLDPEAVVPMLGDVGRMGVWFP